MMEWFIYNTNWTCAVWGVCISCVLCNSDHLDLAEFYLVWKWHIIFCVFHNSQAIWPNDRHAWQYLLLQSLTKLGVYWVCAGCNKLATCKAHLGHIEQSASPWEEQKDQDKLGKRKFKNINSFFLYSFFQKNTDFADAKSRCIFFHTSILWNRWDPLQTGGKSDTNSWALLPHL